jgi:N4-gp56 family major capsid protein
MANMVNYGDISPRTAAYVIKDLLTRAMPYMVLEKFGQTYPIPQNNTKTAKFRRYFLIGTTGANAGNAVAGPNGQQNPFYTPLALTPLVEGVTPAGNRLSNVDYTVALNQYGDYVTITDVVMDTHEDPILREATAIMSEQAAMTIEVVRYNILKAGTNVFYGNGAVRTAVNTALTTNLQRSITTSILRQNGKLITSAVKSTPDYRTEPVEAAFIGLAHPDLETDIRTMNGFISTKQYGTTTPYENEIGAVERVRYLTSTIFTPFPDAGGAKSNGSSTMRSTSGTLADVYPVLFIAKDAYGIVPLKGKDSITPMVVNPKPAPGDPLAQRGTVGWKAWQSAIILQDAYLVRAEVGATASTP